MIRPSDGQTEVRSLISRAYDPRGFAEAGRRVIDALAAHLASVQRSGERVLNWREPEANYIDARAALAGAGSTQGSARALGGEGFARRLEELLGMILSRGQTLHDPRYIGHQVPPPVPYAALFEAVSALTCGTPASSRRIVTCEPSRDTWTVPSVCGSASRTARSTATLPPTSASTTAIPA